MEMWFSRGRQRVLLILAFLVITSCTALPPPQEWSRERALQATGAAAGRSPRPAAGEIRRLSWEEALRLARERNPGVEAARRRIGRSEALLREAKALAYPSLDATASYVRFIEAAQFRGRTGSDVSGSETRTRFFTGSGSDIYSARIGVAYPLFDGGDAYYAREAAAASVEAAEEDARSILNQLEMLVTETFLDALISRGAIRIAEDALSFTKGEEERARARAEAGEGLKIDALRFATRASEETLALNQVRAQRRVQVAVLAELLDVELSGDVQLTEPEGELELPGEGLITAALAARPELRAIRARRLEAQSRLSREAAKRWPAVNVFGSYGLLALDSVKLSDDQDELQVGAALSMNLFEGGATLARLRAARQELAELESQEREIGLQIERQVRQATVDLEVARRNVEVSRETVALAQEVLKRVTAQYRAGEAQVIDVTEAELQRTRSQLALLRSRVNLLRFQARLRNALGEGLFRQ